MKRDLVNGSKHDLVQPSARGASGGAGIQSIFKGTSLFWVCQLAGWSLYALVLFVSNLPFLSVRSVITYRGASLITCFAASFVLRAVCRRQWRQGLRFPRSFLIVFAWCAGLAFASALLSFAAEQSFRNPTDRVFIIEHADWTPLLTLLINVPGTIGAGLILVAWSALYFGIKYYAALQGERERALAAENSAREAQLQALRYQIHPHFLFNTLNAISTLVLEGESDAAASMIARLADFLRSTLDAKTAHEVPLSEELHLTEQYLEIEKLRLGDRLDIQINVDRCIADCLVPHLVLQPLVENAIRHGIAPSDQLGHLAITGEKLGDWVLIKINDDGLGSGPAITGYQEEPRVGLANIKKRLERLYGSAGRCELIWPPEGGCEVRLQMPYRRTNGGA
jgi:two-component system sensor histidine kinase AlgZ